MKLKYILFSLVAVLSVSCEKNSDLTLPLAVNSRKIVLNATGGETEVEIYSTSTWNVSFDSNVDWASLNRLRGAGNDFIVLSYAPNYDVHRAVSLLIKTSSELSDTVKFIQKGSDVVLNFDGSAEAAASDTEASIDLKTNLENHFDEVAITVKYVKYLYDDEDDEDVPEPAGDWISEIKLYSDKAVCKFSQNTGAERPRKASITLEYTDVYGTLFTTTSYLVQDK